MSNTSLYFGNLENFQYVKCMLTEMPSNTVGYSEVVNLQSGGANVFRSWGRHKEFDVSWKGTMDEVGVFSDYADGVYGTGHLFFTMPSAERSNLFAPNWAAPRLISLETNGWPEIYNAVSTTSTTAANSYNQPPVSVTYTTIATIPARKFLIPIPPDKTLHLGWSGSSTGAGAVYYRPVTAAGATPTYGTPVALTPIVPTSSTRLNATIAGSAAVAVQVYLYGAGTVTVASLMAQLWPTGASPTLTGVFKPGRGVSGLKWDGHPSWSVVQDTDSTNGSREFFTMNGTLVEIGSWT